MCRQLGLEVGDLAVQFVDDADRGARGCGVSGTDTRWRGTVVGAQRRCDFLRTGVDVALAREIIREPQRPTTSGGVGSTRGLVGESTTTDSVGATDGEDLCEIGTAIDVYMRSRDECDRARR